MKDRIPRGGSTKSGERNQRPKEQQRKGGKSNRFEPINIKELTASPTIVSYFQEVGCYEFYDKVQRIHSHPQLTKLFVFNLHEHHVHLVGVNFELTTNAISVATGIPFMGDKWFKQVYLDLSHYQVAKLIAKPFSPFLICWIDMLPS